MLTPTISIRAVPSAPITEGPPRTADFDADLKALSERMTDRNFAIAGDSPWAHLFYLFELSIEKSRKSPYTATERDVLDKCAKIEKCSDIFRFSVPVLGAALMGTAALASGDARLIALAMIVTLFYQRAIESWRFKQDVAAASFRQKVLDTFGEKLGRAEGCLTEINTTNRDLARYIAMHLDFKKIKRRMKVYCDKRHLVSIFHQLNQFELTTKAILGKATRTEVGHAKVSWGAYRSSQEASQKRTEDSLGLFRSLLEETMNTTKALTTRVQQLENPLSIAPVSVMPSSLTGVAAARPLPHPRRLPALPPALPPAIPTPPAGPPPALLDHKAFDHSPSPTSTMAALVEGMNPESVVLPPRG